MKNMITYNSISSETVRDIDIKPIGGCQGRLTLCRALYEKILEVSNEAGEESENGQKSPKMVKFKSPPIVARGAFLPDIYLFLQKTRSKDLKGFLGNLVKISIV